jgi:hypothetical protein
MFMQQAPVKKKKKIKVPKVVNGVETMVEIEVDDEGGPGWGPNDKHTLLNHRLTRVDGPVTFDCPGCCTAVSCGVRTRMHGWRSLIHRRLPR